MFAIAQHCLASPRSQTYLFRRHMKQVIVSSGLMHPKAALSAHVCYRIEAIG